MNHSSKGALPSGRANTILVFGQEDDVKAVVSSVVARITEQSAEDRVRFTGSALFDDKSIKHIIDVILPMIDRVCQSLGLPKKHFEISLVNLSAASIMDVGMSVTGYSADVPVVMSMLSASLEMVVPQNMAFTGHMASVDGDIRMVRSLPIKLKAAIQEEAISTFIHPVVDKDSSLASFSPKEKERVSGAISEAKRLIRTEAVHDLSELITMVFSDEQVVSSSLKLGYYQASFPVTAKQTPIEKSTEYLTMNHDPRFWNALEYDLLGNRCEDAKELVLLFAQFHISHKRYPVGLGRKLLRLVQSLPPETRRLKISFPLLPLSMCIQLSQFASDADYEDVPILFKSISGHASPPLRKKVESNSLEDDPEHDPGDKKLQLVLSELNEDALTLIGLPIDTARASYLMESVTAESHDAFLETITSFYVHLMRHIGMISDPIDWNISGGEALALLQRAFSGDGGFNKALSQAIDGTKGGLRAILDIMTAQFKREEQEKHVNMVLKTALDPLKFEDKIGLITELLNRLSPHLPPDIVSQPPERYAGHYETIVKAYVQSMDQMKSVLHSL